MRRQVSSYSFETHAKSSSIRVLNIKEGTSRVISEDLVATDPIWIGEQDVLFLKHGDNGCTMIMSQNVNSSE